MIKKIISSGQTGADRAALDVALKFNIPHGGWITRGRRAEDGPLTDQYNLKELTTSCQSACTERNVMDSDGTLIFSRSKPTSDTKYTRQIVQQQKKHLLHIDLNKTTTYDASSLILSWIKLQNIMILNVTGPKELEDEKIYGDVFRVLEFACVMQEAKRLNSSCQSKQVETVHLTDPPKTVEEAIDRLTTELSLKDKTIIANLAEEELDTLNDNLGVYIWNTFGFWSDNQELLDSFHYVAKDLLLSQERAIMVIIKELWKRLRRTHRLRVVK
jgi:hypothetical protein